MEPENVVYQKMGNEMGKMMNKILIFAGTKEGRLLAEHLCSCGLEVHISVATEYGREVLQPTEHLVVQEGRLDRQKMEELLQSADWLAVIDATHPYAVEVSANLQQSCKAAGKKYLRLVREEREEKEGFHSFYVDTREEAADYLNQREGNILFTTGSKDLKEYLHLILDSSRIYARILADGDMVNECRDMGLTGKQIICMQGPFSAELNEAMLRQVNARYLVTKESGETGGFSEKLAGAKAAGAVAVVIRRPKKEDGYSMEELLRSLYLPPMPRQKQQVTLLGIGMGDMENMTLEAYQICRQADVILGAERMVKTLEPLGRPVEAIYQPQTVLEFLEHHPRYQRVVVAFSGDVGFYSGAANLQKLLEDKKYNVKLICGISSVVYMASRLGMPWQDMKLVSMHGRTQNLVDAVKHHEKVFALAGKADSIRELAKSLCTYGLSEVVLHVGYQLSYPEESFFSGKAKAFTAYDREGLSVVVVENPAAAEAVVTHGLADEAFLRGQAPMTKEEIRSVSLSKLALTKKAVVYDIGAGTGSVGIECALQTAEGMVYAIEKKEEAWQLLLENKNKLGTANLIPVKGTAPEALKDLPMPTHAFIGGSGGNLEEIVALLLEKNPKVRIVINAIALETVAEVTQLMKKRQFAYHEAVQVSVNKARKLGNYHMMTGLNPVYIFTLQEEI